MQEQSSCQIMLTKHLAITNHLASFFATPLRAGQGAWRFLALDNVRFVVAGCGHVCRVSSGLKALWRSPKEICSGKGTNRNSTCKLWRLFGPDSRQSPETSKPRSLGFRTSATLRHKPLACGQQTPLSSDTPKYKKRLDGTYLLCTEILALGHRPQA